MERLYQSLRIALAQVDKQQIFFSSFFSLFNFLSFQIPPVFPLFIHQVLKSGKDRGHIAFQVAFKSNYSFLVGALGLSLP